MLVSPLHPLYWLAEQGCTFVLVHPHSKNPIHARWPDTPISLNKTVRHVQRGGNVGVLLGAPSDNLVCLDLDLHFPLGCALYPELAQIRITRPNAPERGKLLFRLTSTEELTTRKWAFCDTASPTVELLTRRAQAILPPSIHPSGVPYVWQCTTTDIPLCTPALLASLWEVLTADTFAWYNRPTPIQCAPVSMSLTTPYLATGQVDIPAIRTALKTRFPSALAVFQHFGRAEQVQAVGPTDMRLCGHGGLIVGNPHTSVGWRWYCFRDKVGGDVIDAVGYCLMGQTWNRSSRASWQHLQHFSAMSPTKQVQHD